jgi:putative restriction endonuclease
LIKEISVSGSDQARRLSIKEAYLGLLVQVQMNILDQVKSVSVWKNGNHRAIHKPLALLILLGSYCNRGQRLMAFDVFSKKFAELVHYFGTNRTKNNPHYPFWRLKNDGSLWQVESNRSLSVNAKGDVGVCQASCRLN